MKKTQGEDDPAGDEEVPLRILRGRMDGVWGNPLHAPENVAQMEAFFTKSVSDPVTPGFAADFDDVVLDARHWFSLKSVEPAQAAMLLCEFNPNTEELDHARQLTGLVTGPHDLQLLLQRFEDEARHDPRPRSLQQWLQFARASKLRYHPWIDRYVEAAGVAVEPVERAPIATAAVELPTETAKERRARLLDWWEAEEAAKGKLGALARVFAREKTRRPTADRANVGADVRKARTERAEARRAGAFGGLLGKAR